MSKPLLSMSKIEKSFYGTQVLLGVELNIYAGEIHALMGENGAGKSTLMNILGGVITYDKGKILMDEKELKFENPSQSINCGISFIHQELSLVPTLSIAENLLMGRLPMKQRRVDWKTVNIRAKEILQTIGLSIDVKVNMGALSTGHQQLVEIARAISMNPKILIMDEPTSALTKSEIEQLFVVLKSLRGKGMAIIFISHNMDEIMELSDRVTVLRDGKTILCKQKNEISAYEIAKSMLGKELVVEEKEHKICDEICLEVQNITQGIKLKNVSMNVHRGEIVGIAGQLGAGKTELLNAVYGESTYDKGRVKLLGKKLPKGNIERRITRGMYLVPEDRKLEGLVLGMSISDNITLPVLDKVAHVGIINKIKQAKIATSMIEKLAIKTTNYGKPVGKLSGGNQQKVVLSRWVSMKPKVLLLDQPTRGIDVGAKEEIYKLMENLANEGVGIVFVATEISELIRTCSRVYVMRNGEIVSELGINEGSQSDILSAIAGGGKHEK